MPHEAPSYHECSDRFLGKLKDMLDSMLVVDGQLIYEALHQSFRVKK